MTALGFCEFGSMARGAPLWWTAAVREDIQLKKIKNFYYTPTLVWTHTEDSRKSCKAPGGLKDSSHNCG